MSAARPNDVHTSIVNRGVIAKVRARGGDLEGADRLAREAIAFAETTDFLHSHADLVADLAEVLALANRPDESTEMLEQAIALYELKGSRLALESARRSLRHATRLPRPQ
jgi:hypothetical protein